MQKLLPFILFLAIISSFAYSEVNDEEYMKIKLVRLKESTKELKQKLIQIPDHFSLEQKAALDDIRSNVGNVETFVKEALDGKKGSITGAGFKVLHDRNVKLLSESVHLFDSISRKSLEFSISDNRTHKKTTLLAKISRGKNQRFFSIHSDEKFPQKTLNLLMKSDTVSLSYYYFKPGYDFIYEYKLIVEEGVVKEFTASRRPRDKLRMLLKGKDKTTAINLINHQDYSTQSAINLIKQLKINLRKTDLLLVSYGAADAECSGYKWWPVLDFFELGERNFYAQEK